MEKVNNDTVFTGLGSVRLMKTCDLWLENATVAGLGQHFRDLRHHFSL